MILVYVTNKRLDEVADRSFKGRVSYRNPRYFDKPEKCDAVYIHGHWPEIESAYEGKVLSSDYPKHTGAGWYELSNGDTVRGKENAIEAENKL